MDKKIKPHRHLPSKTPHPKFQCWTKLYLTSSVFRVWFFSPPDPKRAAQRQHLNLGEWELTTIQQGFDFIVHLRSGDGGAALHTSSFVSSHEGRFGLSSAQIPVLSYYLIPNSISFSITYSYYLIPITCVFSGKRCSGVCKRRKDYLFCPMFLNAWTEQTHFDCKNTGNRN